MNQIIEKTFLATASVVFHLPRPRHAFLSAQPDSSRAQNLKISAKFPTVLVPPRHPGRICGSDKGIKVFRSTHSQGGRGVTKFLTPAATAMAMAASIEAWTGDPVLMKTPTWVPDNVVEASVRLLESAARIAAKLQAWANNPVSMCTEIQKAVLCDVKTAAEMVASLEAWTGDPIGIINKLPTAATRTAKTAAQMTAAMEAWEGDPSSHSSSKVLVYSRNTTTAVEMMTSFEAWTGDPLLFGTSLFSEKASVTAKTAVHMMASLVAWDGDPLVRTATDIAASLEAWIGYPHSKALLNEQRKKSKKKEKTG